MDKVRWLTEAEERAWRGLQLMQMRLVRELERQLANESDLSYSDYVVLIALTDQVDGRMRQFELGELLSWEKSRLSHHLRRMQQRGLVTKRPCPEDLRGAFVVITQQGRASIEAAAPGHLAIVRRLFVDRLSAKQLKTVAEIAETVLEASDKEPDG